MSYYLNVDEVYQVGVEIEKNGGAFYRVQKYGGAPEQLPSTLHWFKYEAYFTWVTGMLLLVFTYCLVFP